MALDTKAAITEHKRYSSTFYFQLLLYLQHLLRSHMSGFQLPRRFSVSLTSGLWALFSHGTSWKLDKLDQKMFVLF